MQKRQRHQKVQWKRDELYELYWGKQLSSIEIATILGVSFARVCQKLNELQIPQRTHSDTIKLAYQKGRLLPHLRSDIDGELVRKLYCDEGMTVHEVAQRIGAASGTVRRILHEEGVTRKWTETRQLQYLKGAHGANWKGGRRPGKNGYIYIFLQPNDPYYPMTRNGYVPEHRLVMARHLGRCLESWETVHHKDHIKDHNELSNLKLLTVGKHNQLTLMEKTINRLRKRLALLEAQNTLLKHGKP